MAEVLGVTLTVGRASQYEYYEVLKNMVARTRPTTADQTGQSGAIGAPARFN